MGLYRLTQEDNYFGKRNISFFTCSDAYQGTYVRIIDNITIGSVNEAMLRIDEALGSDEWQHCVGGFYNPDIVNRADVLSALHNLYPAVKSLDQLYSANATLYSSSTINGVNNSLTGSVTFSGVNNITTNLGGSILHFVTECIEYSATDWQLHIILPCFFDHQVTEDGFNLTLGEKRAELTIELNRTRSGLILTLRMNASTYSVNSTDIGMLAGVKPKPWSPDPYDDDDDGDSDEGGGSGSDDQDNWGDDSDDNPVPPLPGLSAVDSGFITLFNPTLAQLKNLAHYMWSNLFDITAFKRLYADPMDVILGLAIVPVDVTHGSLSSVCIGNVSTGVQMYKALSQYVEVDCGKVKVGEKWHSYLDYGPYTKIHIMLPYIGAKELDVNEIMGREVGVKYHVDILNGACVAFVTVTTSDNKEHVIAQFSGQCSISIPVSSKDYTNTIIALTNLVATGATLATGGLAAPTEAAAVAGAASETANITANVINSKPRVAMSGNLGGGSGLLGVQKPFLIFERPKLCRPEAQKTYTGYPSYITLNLGSLKGFSQIRDIHLNNFTMTDEEHTILLDLLREGVIL